MRQFNFDINQHLDQLPKYTMQKRVLIIIRKFHLTIIDAVIIETKIFKSED